MKARKNKTSRDRSLPAQWAADVAFELTPVTGVVPQELVRIKFMELQSGLVKDCLGETRNPIVRGGIHRAANEAAALSWTTSYPLLVMPALFHEKAREARRRLDKQQIVSMQTERLIAVAINPECN